MYQPNQFQQLSLFDFPHNENTEHFYKNIQKSGLFSIQYASFLLEGSQNPCEARILATSQEIIVDHQEC